MQREDQQAKTAGGVLLPEAAREKLPIGVVIEVSACEGANPKDHLTIRNLPTGSKVIFAEYSGQKIPGDGPETLLLDFEDILGIIHE